MEVFGEISFRRAAEVGRKVRAINLSPCRHDRPFARLRLTAPYAFIRQAVGSSLKSRRNSFVCNWSNQSTLNRSTNVALFLFLSLYLSLSVCLCLSVSLSLCLSLSHLLSHSSHSFFLRVSEQMSYDSHVCNWVNQSALSRSPFQIPAREIKRC